MTKEKKKFQLLTSENVCNVYKILYKNGCPPTKESVDKIESLEASVNSSYFGQEIYKSFEEKAVAYLYFIIKVHAFIDGNKRVACFCFSIICDLNGLVPKYKDFSLDELAVYLGGSDKKEYQKLIKAVSRLLF